MYRRLDEKRIQELMGPYTGERVYQMLSPALQALSEHYDDLTPVEVWDEAVGVIETLKKTRGRKDVCVRQVRSNLLNRYKDFAWEDGRIEHREKDCYTRSADMVMMVVTIMLRSAKKEREENPYLKILNILVELLQASSIKDYFLDRSEKMEEKEEKEYGEIPEKDYLAGEEDEIKAMLLKGKEFAVEGFAEQYEAFVEEMLGEEDVRTLLMGAKSLYENFHAKAVYWILGVMMMEGVIDVSAKKMAEKLGSGNRSLYLAQQNTDFPPGIQEYISDLCQQYKRGAK